MKITAIRTAILRVVGPCVFVKIDTDDGLTGLGECYPAAPASAIVETINAMGEHLLGQDPRDVNRLHETIRRFNLFTGAQGGTVITALSGVEMALWDLLGKSLGAPVYRLLGGKFRDRVRLYADTGAGAIDAAGQRVAGPPAATPDRDAAMRDYSADMARRALARGFDAIKADIDDKDHPAKRDAWNWTLTPPEIDSIVSRAAHIRATIGPSVDFALDGHARFDLPSAIQLARELAPLKLMWLEEPVPPDSVEALAQVRAASPVPICAGENVYTRFGLNALIAGRRGRRGHARPGPLRRHRRGPAHRRPGRAGRPALRAAQRVQPAGHHGHGPRLRRHPELPHPGVARAGARLLGRAGGQRRRPGHPERRRRPHRGAWLGDGIERRRRPTAYPHPPEPRLFRRANMSDKVIVTGAGTGIGYAIARSFAHSGAWVTLNDMDGALAERSAQALNDEIGEERVAAYALDVADAAGVRQMVAGAAERDGRAGCVVANAGLTNYGSFLEYTPEAFDRLTSVNLRGSYFTAQAGAQAMIARGTRGRILLMSSVTGLRAFRNLSAYGITKAGLRFMASVLALELGPYGITVNAIGPGATVTDRTLADDPHFEANWATVTPNGRAGTVADVVAAARFLASPEAGHVTGQTLMVDGGWTLHSPLPEEHPALPKASSELK